MQGLMDRTPGRGRAGVYRVGRATRNGPRPRRPRAALRAAAVSCWLALTSLVCAAQAPGTGESTPGSFRAPPPSSQQTARDVAARRPLVHLDVRDTAARYRPLEQLTYGVPFAQGLLPDAAALRVWRDDDGRPLPAQARNLSRWPDGSVRWALLDTRVELQMRGALRVAAGLAADLPAASPPWRLQTREDGAILLDDGDSVWTVYEPRAEGDRLLGLSALLTDRFGYRYVARVDPASLEWLEWGPLRAVARLRGCHRGLDEHALPIDFHTFTAHLHLYAGMGRAHVEWSLENTPLRDAPGRLAFASYELLLDAPAAPQRVELPVRSVEPAQAFDLSQTRDGTRMQLDGQAIPVGEDPQADLWAGIVGSQDALFVHLDDSAGNHPMRLAWKPGAEWRLGLLAPGTPETFFLDDATRKTFRFDLQRATDAALGRQATVQLVHPAHAALDPSEVRDSLAWGDAGHVYVPGPVELARPCGPPVSPPRGWAHWGEAIASNTHQSGSPRNQLSVFLLAMQSGRADLFRWARTRAFHAMDLRPYHIAGFRAADSPWANLYEGLPHANNPPSQSLGRAGIDGRWPKYKEGLPSRGHGYNGFDPEHMTLDDVYECYLLTGSWPALDALVSAGQAMLTWKELLPDGGIHSSRTFGWTLRALVQVFRATGDSVYLEAARAYVARADDERGHGDVKWLRRMPPDQRHLADQPYDAPFMVAVALHGLSAYWAETADPRVPPMAADLTAFCMSAFRGNGFLDDLPTDVPADRDLVVRSPLGVGSWIPGAVAAAAYITGDHAPVDQMLPYYALLKAHTSKTVEFGGSDWHWWQTYMASLHERLGDGAVFDPAGYLQSHGWKR